MVIVCFLFYVPEEEVRTLCYNIVAKEFIELQSGGGNWLCQSSADK